jgi:hypothetical protein
MKLTSTTLLVLICITTTLSAQNLDWASKVGTRSFPSGEKVYSVNKYGAVNDGKTINTKSIQKAIDACAKKGGGVVSFQAGTYVTGALFLKDNVHPVSRNCCDPLAGDRPAREKGIHPPLFCPGILHDPAECLWFLYTPGYAIAVFYSLVPLVL